MSGKRVVFGGGAMAAVIQGVEAVRALIGWAAGRGGVLAVMCCLSSPYQATPPTR